MRYRTRQPIVIGTLITLVIALMAGTSLALAAPTPPPYRGCAGVESVPVTDTAIKQQVLDLLNQHRGSSHALTVINSLTIPAELHAIDMGYDGYHHHDSMDPDPNHSGQCLSQCGMEERITSYHPGYWGEIIAWGYRTPADVVDGWMRSQVHHDIIMNLNYDVAGIGYYTITRNGNTDYLWVVDFGIGGDPETPPSTPTSTPVVTLTATPTATVGPPPPSPTDGPAPTSTTVPTNVPDPTILPQNEKVFVPFITRG